jgi:hypothetical protein
VFRVARTAYRWQEAQIPTGSARISRQAVLHSLNSVLAEPIQDVLMEDASGRLCIEAKDHPGFGEDAGMTAGNIFHGA